MKKLPNLQPLPRGLEWERGGLTSPNPQLLKLSTILKKNVSKLCWDVYFGKSNYRRERGLNCSHITLNLKKDTITSNFKSNEPHLKFIRSLIPLKTCMTQGISFSPSTLDALLHILCTILNKMPISQIQPDAFGAKRGSWEGG